MCVYLILMTLAVSMYYADVSIVNMEIYSIVYESFCVTVKSCDPNPMTYVLIS